jgi:hypothetical protein
MAKDSTAAWSNAVRAILGTDSTLRALVKGTGVYYGEADRPAEMPYVLINEQSNVTHGALGTESYRQITILVKACVVDAGGGKSWGLAIPIKERLKYLLDGTEREDWIRVSAALNARLSLEGWNCFRCAEFNTVSPYSDRIGDAKRWHNGYLFQLFIEPTG